MKAMKQVLISILLFAAVHSVCGQAQDEQRPSFKNESGWIWHMPPSPADWTGMATEHLVMRLDELKSESLLLTVAHPTESTRDVVRFRPVAFNAASERFEFAFDSGGSTEGVAMEGYRLDLKTLPRDQVKFLGIEKLTKDNLRDVIAPAAFQSLRKAGLDALPFPRIGERYEFELTAIDGRKVSSTTLRGKVVLLDFWARWCGPCMAKMPKLKEAYQRLKGEGFEIVGLNHDYALETAKRVIDEQKLSWPDVLAPVDKDRRGLWMSATGTTSLPRLLLIDREGVLRADVSPHELVAEIEKLMAKR